MTPPTPISVSDALARLRFLPDRRPDSSEEAAAEAFARLSEYRDGAIFVGHWAGASAWERHPVGDEIVMVLEGVTTIFFWVDGAESPTVMRAGDLVVVPQGIWHRFETPEAVKVMSVTPQPTDHQATPPD